MTGRLLLPPSGCGPFPIVVLQHGLGGSSLSPYLDAAAGPWAGKGAAVASIDFPLHGTRCDQKLVELLPDGVCGAARGSAEALAVELARQAVIDLERSLDALCGMDGLDPGRIAYAGFGLGAMLGAAFCALDPRPRAAALALGGSGGPSGIDPARYIGRLAPRPVLLVNAERDATLPRSAAEALFRAAGEPRQQLWFDAPHDGLPGAALEAIWRFLAPHLEVEA